MIKELVKELVKKLNLLGGFIYSDNYSLIGNIVELIKENKAEVSTIEWDNYSWDKFEPAPDKSSLKYLSMPKLDNGETWITYRECTKFAFYIENGLLLCNAKIYEGGACSGIPTDLRFSTKIVLPIAFIVELEKEINSDFRYYWEIKYQQMLAKQKEDWIEAQIDKFLR